VFQKPEPVALATALTQLVSAVIALLLIFEVIHWSTEQVGAFMAAWAALTAVVFVFVRNKVTPV
jgi:hypothetical protein